MQQEQIIERLERIEKLLQKEETVYLNKAQIQAKYYITKSTIDRRVKDGLLHKYVFGGKVFFDEAELKGLIKKGKEPLQVRA